MTILKLTPRNLPGIQKHFEKQKSEIEKKLHQLTKKRIELEKELETCKDGIEWCEKVYESSKGK